MLRRLLPTLVLLGAGLLALLVGLWALHRFVRAERDEASAELSARRRALEQYALEAWRSLLAARLRAASADIERAAVDPLADPSGLYLSVAGEQVVPVPSPSRAEQASGAADSAGRGTTAGGRAKNATSAHAEQPSGAADPAPSAETSGSAKGRGAIAGGRSEHEAPPRDESPVGEMQPATGDADDPWTVRQRLLADLKRSLAAKHRAGIEAAVRGILAVRAAYVVAPEREVPFTLEALEALSEHARPDPSLMRALIRDGLTGTHSARLEGLQRELLRARARFDDPRRAELCRRVAELSSLYALRHDDFEARCAEPLAEPLGVPAVAGPTYWRGWYFEPDGDRIRGVSVPLDEALLAVSAEMRERGLLGSSDALALRGDAQDAVALSTASLSVESAQWAEAERRMTSRYRLKSGLLFLCAAFAIALGVVAVMAQHRKHRFLEMKSDFVSTVSHELKTPLASVRAMAETLEKRLSGVPAAKDYPARIVREIDALSFLVENILSFNRLDKGRWVAHPEPLRLDELVASVSDDVRATSSARLEVQTEGVESVTLYADPDLLRLLFQNLLRNACRYNARESALVRIEAEPNGAGVWVRVKDNGVGIPPDERENVFKEFYRLPSAARSSGSGLGLAICRRVMALHQGSIHIADSSPEGTTFQLYFPGPA